MDNRAGNWVPNQAVEGWVDIAQTPVELLVDNRALQTFRDWTVVFIRVGNSYEIRPLELGRSDGQFTEVLGGVKTGNNKTGYAGEFVWTGFDYHGEPTPYDWPTIASSTTASPAAP